MSGSENLILGVEPPDVIVATTRSPQGQRVPIAWVDDALERLRVDGAITIAPSNVGFRSAFIGAVLKTLPGARVKGSPPTVSLEVTGDDATHEDSAAGPWRDDNPRWQQHTGGSGHEGAEWDPNDDLIRAQAFYSSVKGRARVILDLLIDHPGRPLSVTDIRAMTGEFFADSSAVAGSLAALSQPRQASERRYPFYWWRGQPTQYAMKPGVAELFRRARNAVSDDRHAAAAASQTPGTRYRSQDEDVDVAPAAPAVSADPDSFGHGLRSHRRLQNGLAELLERAGLEPLSPAALGPEYDLAWFTDGTMTVVEVKSTTARNEVRQLRMGLGQVLDYHSELERRGFTVRPVLYVQHEPVEERWMELTAAAGVVLAWPGAEDRLGLPSH